MNDPDSIPMAHPVSDDDGAPGELPVPPGGQVLASGALIDRAADWVLVRQLGKGGFGEVWLARHKSDELRAVKFGLHVATRERLLGHEKTVLLRVQKHLGKHPNIVPLLAYSLEADVPWLMYEFVPGGTLSTTFPGWAALPSDRRVGRAVRVLHPLVGALAELHRLRTPLVHRDLKPANILMSGDTPRLTDFGISAAVLDPLPGAVEAPTGMSAALPSVLASAGTVRYAPPEQMLGSPPNPRDDVYALGMIAYQLILADRTAAPGTDAADILRDRGAPPALAALIVQSVSMDPARRPADAGAWATVLTGLLDAEGAEPPQPAVSADVAFEQAERFYHGAGRPRDDAQAREWYERAAKLGHPGAEYSLGGLAYHGHGEPQNHQKAREWYEKAAARGHTDACFALALMLEFGQGGAQNHAGARDWYERAAKVGDAEAQFRLGALYLNGRGGAADPNRAREWFTRAAAAGHKPAVAALERLNGANSS